MKKLSIVTPVYFNEQSLPSLFEALLELESNLNERQVALQLVFVDDGSGDGSLAELVKFKDRRPETTVVKLARNFGSMQALRAGLKYVDGDAFTFLSADLQDPPELIVKMVEQWLQGSKYVVCARTSRQDPIVSKMFSKLYYGLLRLLVVKDYPEGGYDLALMDKSMLPYLRDSGKYTNLLLYAHSLGFPSHVIKYERQERKHGKSMWTFAKKLNFFIDSILGFSILPLRYISLIGVTVAFFSVVYGLFVVFNAIFGSTNVPGWASTIVLLSFLFGVVIFMLGIIGEYLWRIFNQVSGSPDSVVDEVY